MKLTAKFFNVALIIAGVYLLFQMHSPPRGFEILIVILIFAAPIFSLFALIGATHSESWLSLFLQRKKLEEQTKIGQIKDRDLSSMG